MSFSRSGAGRRAARCSEHRQRRQELNLPTLKSVERRRRSMWEFFRQRGSKKDHIDISCLIKSNNYDSTFNSYKLHYLPVCIIRRENLVLLLRISFRPRPRPGCYQLRRRDKASRRRRRRHRTCHIPGDRPHKAWAGRRGKLGGTSVRSPLPGHRASQLAPIPTPIDRQWLITMP